MKIGIVCPYSFDVSGGVQAHVVDLHAELMRRGHEVSVLAPGTGEYPEWLTCVSGAIAIPYNGSIARLAFGPAAIKSTKAWLTDGDFDVVHVHEPTTPSVSMLALAHAKVPVVGTFHTAMESSYALRFGARSLSKLLERLAGRIAVSAEARRTLTQHQGGDAVIIPNGIHTAFFSEAKPNLRQRPLVTFLGRIDEERKGLPIFLDAIQKVLADGLDIDVAIAGRGQSEAAEIIAAHYPKQVSILGSISDEEKAQLLRDSAIYVAPQIGGESFGIVLIEALAAKTAVIASDIPAFSAVLQAGRCGALFPNGDAIALATTITRLITDASFHKQLVQAGASHAASFDWAVITDRIERVYRSVVDEGQLK